MSAFDSSSGHVLYGARDGHFRDGTEFDHALIRQTHETDPNVTEQ